MSAADVELASKDEVAAALSNLSDADLLRIENFARYRSYGLPWIDWQDLFQEAVERALSGSRAWPKTVPFLAFLRETMRSIAHEELRHRLEGPVRGISDLPVGESESMPREVLNAPDPTPGPERQIAAAQALNTILAQFADDESALAVLRGLAEGSSPDEICRAANLTRTKYQSTQRRIRRRLLGIGAQPNQGKLQ
jgi:RNA polymerase sigma factor (sigma-70 family)